MTSPAVNGLRTKHAELQSEKAGLQQRLKSIDTDMAVLVDAIRLIDPEIEISKTNNSTARAFLQDLFARKELMNMVQVCLREANRPIAAAEIADRILSLKAADAPNDVQIMLRKDVSALVAYLYRQKMVERISRDGSIVWQIAP